MPLSYKHVRYRAAGSSANWTPMTNVDNIKVNGEVSETKKVAGGNDEVFKRMNSGYIDVLYNTTDDTDLEAQSNNTSIKLDFQFAEESTFAVSGQSILEIGPCTVTSTNMEPESVNEDGEMLRRFTFLCVTDGRSHTSTFTTND